MKKPSNFKIGNIPPLKSENIKNWTIALFYILLIFIILFANVYVQSLNLNLDRSLEAIKSIATCEIHIGDVYYNGLCTPELQEAVRNNIDEAVK